MTNNSMGISRRVQVGLCIITISVLFFYFFVSIFPVLNVEKELWTPLVPFPSIHPIGTDFREGLFYPAKILLQGKCPYIDYALIYPPMAALFGIPFRVFPIQLAYQIQTIILFILNITCVWGAIRLAKYSLFASESQQVFSTSLIQIIAFPIIILSLTSYGFLFSIERGNFDIYIQIFALLAMSVLFKKNNIWLECLFFSIAAHLKVYPAILFFIPFWKYGKKSLLPLLSINLGLFFIIGPINAIEFIKTITIYMQEPFLWVGNQSAISFAMLFNHAVSRWTAVQIPYWFFAFLPIAIWMVAAFIAFRRKFNHVNVLWVYAISVPVMNLLPGTSHDYKLVLYYAPLVIALYLLLADLQKTGRILNLIIISCLMATSLVLSTSYTLLPVFMGNKYPFGLILQILFLLSMLITEEKSVKIPKLKLLHVKEYVGVNRDDPIRLYSIPIVGQLYQKRVELCLAELTGGERVLEIGFGSGVAFFNLHDQYQEIFGLDLTASTRDIELFFKEKGIDTHLQNGSVLEMPYPDNFFDSVFLVSILEHLQPADQRKAFMEISRVLKPGGQIVYGVPVERPLMVFFFRVLGYDIRQHHFSTEMDVFYAAKEILQEKKIVKMGGPFGIPQNIYQIGHFTK